MAPVKGKPISRAEKSSKAVKDASSLGSNINRFSSDELNQIHVGLLEWYDNNHRVLPWRRTPLSKRLQPPTVDLNSDPATQPAPSNLSQSDFAYRVWVSEVMLQQTQVATVIPYFLKWVEKWPSVSALAAADQEEVNAMWAGLGYYRRARQLLDGAKFVVSHLNGQLPSDPKDLLRIPGIGPYTSAAISSIVFSAPAAAVDGNVIRVLSRLRTIEGDPTKLFSLHSELANSLLDCTRPGDFNQAVMELGAVVCRPLNPSCHTCPIASNCLALKRVAEYEAREGGGGGAEGKAGKDRAEEMARRKGGGAKASGKRGSSGGEEEPEGKPSVTDYPSRKIAKEKRVQIAAVAVLDVRIRIQREGGKGERDGRQGGERDRFVTSNNGKEGNQEKERLKKKLLNENINAICIGDIRPKSSLSGSDSAPSSSKKKGGKSPSSSGKQTTLMDRFLIKPTTVKRNLDEPVKEEEPLVKQAPAESGGAAEITQGLKGSVTGKGSGGGEDKGGYTDETSLLLLTQRPKEGLLAGLWEFPGKVLYDSKPDHAATSEFASVAAVEGMDPLRRREIVDELLGSILSNPPAGPRSVHPALWYAGGGEDLAPLALKQGGRAGQPDSKPPKTAGESNPPLSGAKRRWATLDGWGGKTRGAKAALALAGGGDGRKAFRKQDECLIEVVDVEDLGGDTAASRTKRTRELLEISVPQKKGKENRDEERVDEDSGAYGSVNGEMGEDGERKESGNGAFRNDRKRGSGRVKLKPRRDLREQKLGRRCEEGHDDDDDDGDVECDDDNDDNNNDDDYNDDDDNDDDDNDDDYNDEKKQPNEKPYRKGKKGVCKNADAKENSIKAWDERAGNQQSRVDSSLAVPPNKDPLSPVSHSTSPLPSPSLLKIVSRRDVGQYVHIFSHIRQINVVELVTVELDVEAFCALAFPSVETPLENCKPSGLNTRPLAVEIGVGSKGQVKPILPPMSEIIRKFVGMTKATLASVSVNGEGSDVKREDEWLDEEEAEVIEIAIESTSSMEERKGDLETFVSSEKSLKVAKGKASKSSEASRKEAVAELPLMQWAHRSYILDPKLQTALSSGVKKMFELAFPKHK